MLYTLYLHAIPIYLINQDDIVYYKFHPGFAYRIGEHVPAARYHQQLATPEQIALLSDEQVLEYL